MATDVAFERSRLLQECRDRLAEAEGRLSASKDEIARQNETLRRLQAEAEANAKPNAGTDGSSSTELEQSQTGKSSGGASTQ